MKPSAGRPSHPGSVSPDRVNVHAGSPLTELLTAVIYVLNFIYLSHFYAKYKLDPQLVFMEMFNIGALSKVLIVGIQYGCIALALVGALSSCPQLFKLPILFQKIIGSAQILFSIYCLCCMLIGRHDWYIFLISKGALQPFPFTDLGWDIETEEMYFTLAMMLSGFLNKFLAHLLRSRRGSLLNALTRSNTARQSPPAYSSVDRSQNTQGSPQDSSPRNSSDPDFQIRASCEFPVGEVIVAVTYIFTFCYVSYYYAKFNLEPQLVFMEMFDIDIFYKVMIMGIHYGCIALTIVGALASCPRILSGSILFQSVLGFVQIFFSIYFLSFIWNGHHIDWCNILQGKEGFTPSPCTDQEQGLAIEIVILLVTFGYAAVNFFWACLLNYQQKHMQSTPIAFRAGLRFETSTRSFDAYV